jgi:hypothetical protein
VADVPPLGSRTVHVPQPQHFSHITTTFSKRLVLDWISLCHSKKLSLHNWILLKLSCDRRPVGQSVLVSGSHVELLTRFFFLPGSWGFLNVWHPLWREDGSVIYLYKCFWVMPEQSLLGTSPTELNNRISLSHLRLPHDGGPGSCFYIPQDQGGPFIPLGTGFPFCRFLWLAGLWWRYSNSPPHSNELCQSYITIVSQSASPSWCQAPIWDPRPIFPILSLIIFLGSFGFVDVGRPLWRELSVQ